MPNNTHLQVGHGEDEIFTLFKALGESQRSRSTTRRGLDGLTPEQRSAEANFSIDPGFVNHRLVDTSLRSINSMDLIDNDIGRLPELPDWLKIKRIGQIYCEALLKVCRAGNAKSLSWLAAQPNPHPGTVICSTDMFHGTSAVFKARRSKTTWIPNCRFDRTARLVFSTEHIFSSTHREALSQKAVISYIARLKQVVGHDLVLEPFVMGAPWVEGIDPALRQQLIFHRYTFYEQYIEDVEEFAEVKKIPHDIDWSPMQRISEKAFKSCIAGLLSDTPSKDWGGERSDHFCSHLHLRGHRATAAFLFKGPARFRPMTAAHLGKTETKSTV
jgi:hypothetical protein